MQYPFSHFAGSAALGLALAAQAWSAQATLVATLPTSLVDADTVFSFSAKSITAMNLLGLSAKALGNASNVGGNAWSFNMPVTEVSVLPTLLPLGLTPVSGKATGSALGISGADGGLILANFALDFKRNVMTADLTTASGTTKGMDIYGFHVADGLKLSSSGGLSMNMALDQMFLTAGARASFLQALQLPDFVDAVMAKLDFGTMKVNVSPALRLGVSDKPFVASASMVPEQTSMAYMLLGLVGLAMVSRRIQKR